LIKKLKYIYDFMKALKYDSLQQYKKALTYLEKQNGFVADNEMMWPEYYILRGEIRARIGNTNQALEDFHKAIDILDTTNYVNNDEKNYLKYYILKWLEYLSNNNRVEEYGEILQNGDEMNIENVRYSFKTNFDITSFLAEDIEHGTVHGHEKEFLYSSSPRENA
jgi:tetratricopeptide (TPR) repeat protein